MSLTVSVIIVFVLLARLRLKKAPKKFSYALWAVVLFQLLCPVSFEASFSILDAGKVKRGWLVYEDTEFMVFEGEILYQTYHDEEKGMMEYYIEASELCSRIQKMLEEELDYQPFDAAQIKDIQSATLDVSSSYTDGKYYKQTITHCVY